MAVGLLMPEVDGFWRNVFVTDAVGQGMVPLNRIGRDWEYITSWQGSLTGVVESAKPRGDFPLAGDTTSSRGSKMFLQQLNQTFPDPLKGPHMQDIFLGVPLRAMVGDMLTTLGQATLESNPGSIVKDVRAREMTAFALHWAISISNFLYQSQNENYQLATIGNVSAITTDGTLFFFTFQPTTEVTARFATGQRLDIYESTGTTRQNLVAAVAIDVYCHYSDELTNTVRCVTATDPTTWTGGIPINGDIVVPANIRDGTAPNFTGIAGLNSYIKSGSTASENSRYILGAERNASRQIDLSEHPEFKSFTKELNGVSLTESNLSQYIQRFNRHYEKQGISIDWLVASDGVWHDYWEQRLNLHRLTREEFINIGSQGPKTATGDFAITVEGKKVRGYSSSRVNDGEVYGGQKNWKKIVPPDIAGLQDLQGTNSPLVPVKFVAPFLTGTDSTRLPVYLDPGTSGDPVTVTEGYRQPCWLRMQLVPEHPAGLKLTGVGSSKIFSDN
jgi:hypothetical protein